MQVNCLDESSQLKVKRIKAIHSLLKHQWII